LEELHSVVNPGPFASEDSNCQRIERFWSDLLTFSISTIIEIRGSTMAKGNDSELTARYADMLSAMGTEPRLRIVRLLLSAHPNGMVVGEVGEELRARGIHRTSLHRRHPSQSSRAKNLLYRKLAAVMAGAVSPVFPLRHPDVARAPAHVEHHLFAADVRRNLGPWSPGTP
jgi:hypothetical protein